MFFRQRLGLLLLGDSECFKLGAGFGGAGNSLWRLKDGQGYYLSKDVTEKAGCQQCRMRANGQLFAALRATHHAAASLLRT